MSAEQQLHSSADALGHSVSSGPSASEYIVHHLQHLQKNFAFENAKQVSLVDFGVFNLDSLVYASALGATVCFLLWLAARRATAGVPGRFQAAVEILFEMVEKQAKGVVHNAQSRRLVVPLALTVFAWIFLMNAMDMLPVDALPALWHSAAPSLALESYMRVVPTADLSSTLGLSVSVLCICVFYNIKIKGLGGWVHELVTAPFGNKIVLYPVNFLMQVIEFTAKTVSHAMRLFGNMFAGELVFMLIALMGGAWAWNFNPLTGGFWLGLGHVVAGTAWSIFHILVITLQAFIFMMLTLIYVGQAHDKH